MDSRATARRWGANFWSGRDRVEEGLTEDLNAEQCKQFLALLEQAETTLARLAARHSDHPLGGLYRRNICQQLTFRSPQHHTSNHHTTGGIRHVIQFDY
jgi:hypothetical protein